MAILEIENRTTHQDAGFNTLKKKTELENRTKHLELENQNKHHETRGGKSPGLGRAQTK